MYKIPFEEIYQVHLAMYSANDAAHRSDHLTEVVGNYGDHVLPYVLKNIDQPRFSLVKDNPKLLDFMIFPIVAHDLFATFRDHHEQLAYHYTSMAIRAVGQDQHLTKGQMEHLALAAKEHRASNKDAPSSILSEIMAVADKGAPDADTTILRAYKYARSKHRCQHTEALARTLEHMKEKFSSAGYTTYSELYYDIYGDRVDVFKETMDNLTLSDVEEVIQRLYTEKSDHLNYMSLGCWVMCAGGALWRSGVSKSQAMAMFEAWIVERGLNRSLIWPDVIELMDVDHWSSNVLH